MTGEGRSRDEPSEGLGWMAAAVVSFAVLAWFGATCVCLMYSGRVPSLNVPQAVGAVLRILGGGYWHDPASAYPDGVRRLMPGAVGWWAATAMIVITVGAATCAALVRVEPQIARERLGRRAYDWRGSRPRAWARGRDMARDRDDPVGFAVGRLDGRPVFSDEESHVAVVAPTRAGKTTRCVVPWLVEHAGPAIVTSTKRDVLELSRTARATRGGKSWIFDPFSPDSTTWSPVAGCESWSHALRQAHWLADATADGGSEIARYWRGEAAKLLAPLLHAAAIDGADIDRVLAWVDAQNTNAPTVILTAAGVDPAALQLRAVADLDPRNRGTTYMSAGSVLSAYRHPEVAASIGGEFTADGFLLSAADTLYVVSAERDQQLLAPIIVSLLSSIIHRAIETGQFRDGGRRLRVLLDEAANIAPLQDLPRMLSQGAGHGIRIATIWQSIGQMRERHGHGTDTVLANSTTKLFLGSITDESTRSYIRNLLGHDPDHDARQSYRATAGALQQAELGRALLIAGNRPPAVVTLPPPDGARSRI